MLADTSYHMVLNAIREFNRSSIYHLGQAMHHVIRNSFQTLLDVTKDINSKQY